MAYIVPPWLERVNVFSTWLLVLLEFAFKRFSLILLRKSFCEFVFVFQLVFGSCLYIGMIGMLVHILEFSLASSLYFHISVYDKYLDTSTTLKNKRFKAFP